MRPAALRLVLSAAVVAVLAALFLARAGCDGSLPAPEPGELVEIAQSDGALWTGVAVTPSGRQFVCYPRWQGPHTNSVVELLASGQKREFPDVDSNLWKPGANFPAPKDAWVCVQNLHADGETVWVLDAGKPGFKSIVPGAPKLVRIDAVTRGFMQWIHFAPTLLTPDSYLNDVRVDHRHGTAYVSDSGAGAILVVDLAKATTRRVLGDHPSTKADAGVIPVVGGLEFRRGPGPIREKPRKPHVLHCNGLALDRQEEWLYWQALTGKTLWRAKTAALSDPSLSDEALGASVERVGETVVADGIEMDDDGNLYLAAVEKDAIVIRRPDSTIATLISDPRLVWPHSLAFGPNDALYVTTSQIHRTPIVYPNTKMPDTPYMLYATSRRLRAAR